MEVGPDGYVGWNLDPHASYAPSSATGRMVQQEARAEELCRKIFGCAFPNDEQLAVARAALEMHDSRTQQTAADSGFAPGEAPLEEMDVVEGKLREWKEVAPITDSERKAAFGSPDWEFWRTGKSEHVVPRYVDLCGGLEVAVFALVWAAPRGGVEGPAAR